MSRAIDVKQEDGQILVERPTDRRDHRALHGLTRSLTANMVAAVTNGFEKRLEIQGVGYRAALKGKNLELALGYSHPVTIEAPEGVDFEVPIPTRIVVRGLSKQASARSRRSSARFARRSPTRARASATRASTCHGRSVSAHDRQDEGPVAAAPSPPGARQGARKSPSVRGCRCSARTAASRRR